MEGAASASMPGPVAPEAHSEAVSFDPNGPGMGLDFDFNNFDMGLIDSESDAINVDRDVANLGYNNIDFDTFDLGDLNINIGMNYSANTANFNSEDALKEAELLLGPREAFQVQEANTSLSVAPLELPNEKYEELTLPEAYTNTGTSTLQEPVHENEMRAQKRKKMDEVDKGHILPEGSRRNRNKTARARGLDSMA
jgi:hypothetical protein